jgi:hypothetical protein
MDQLIDPIRSCPECGTCDHMCRGGTYVANKQAGEPAIIESKYRHKECNRE